MTEVVIVFKTMPMFLKIFIQPLSLWPWVTFVPIFMTAVAIAHEEMAMFEFSMIFYQPLYLWPWVKVNQTGITNYLCAKFYDHSGLSACENGNVWVFQDFLAAAVWVTLGQGP